MSVLTYPGWFSRLLSKIRLDIMQHGGFIPNPLPDTLVVERKRYADFWKVFNRREPVLTTICTPPDNCEDRDHFTLVETENARTIASSFLKDKDKRFRVKQALLENPPCRDLKQAEEFGFEQMCGFLQNISSNKQSFLHLMKFTKQSPVYIEEDQLFKPLQEKAANYGYFYKENRERPNPFIALCKFEENEEFQMTFENCDLFSRSFTNRGLGFTFNNLPASDLLKRNRNINLQSETFLFNKATAPRLITSASPEHALSVVIEANREEIAKYLKSKSDFNTQGELNLKPKNILVALHDPKEGPEKNLNNFCSDHIMSIF